MEIKVLLNGLIQKTALSLQQFNDQVDRIDFVLDRYTDNEVDLSACKAYVYTNAVGQAPDIIKLTDPTTEGGQIRTTWIPTVHTTQFVSKHIGEVAFQLIFKNTGGTPAWWSRPTPLIIPESIDAEGYVSAEMPSFFQQWEDRMNALDAEYEKTLRECKAYSEEAGKSADISFDGAATSTNNAYKTSADAESTASNAQKVEQDLQKVESHRQAVEEMTREFGQQAGKPGGYATLNSAGNVEQNAGNALKLGGFSPEHFATSNSLQDLVPTINAKIEELTYDAEKGVLTATANGTNTSRQIIGLLSSVTEDTTSGDVYFNYRDGGQTVWHKGKDNFIQTAYLDNTSNEIVMVFVSGNEIRIDVASLIDVYDGAQSSSATVSVDNHVISCNVRISPDAGNIIGTNENGLYAQHQSLAAYSTTVQNDSKYLGVNAKAKDSEKIGGKTEAQLNVNSANTATKLGTARSIIVDGVAAGSVPFDGSADVTINLIHKNVPFQIAAVENNAFTWPTASCDSYVINNSNPVMVTLEGVTSGFYGILHVYGNKLDEAFLETQGYILPDYCKEIEILSSAECYEYIFASDGVKKSVTRAVIS